MAATPCNCNGEEKKKKLDHAHSYVLTSEFSLCVCTRGGDLDTLSGVSPPINIPSVVVSPPTQ
jgi:hypothetical protein